MEGKIWVKGQGQGATLDVDAWLDLLDAKGARAALRALRLDVWDKADGSGRVCGGVDGVALVEIERRDPWPNLMFYMGGRAFSARAFTVALGKVAARLQEMR